MRRWGMSRYRAPGLRGLPQRSAALVLAAAFTVVSCTSGPVVEPLEGLPHPSAVATSLPAAAVATTVPPSEPAPALAPGPAGRDCIPPSGTRVPLAASGSAPSRALDLGARWSGAAAVYPLPGYPGEPWSQWGQGLVAPDGSYWSAVGDHRSRDGNSFLYRLGPGADRLDRVADLRSVVGAAPGAWGPGKVHSPMVAGPCGELYFATYWGSSRDAEADPTYPGEHLVRLDPERGEMVDLGTPVPGFGVPSLAGWPERGLLYGEAAHPADPDRRGVFFVYDTRVGKVVFSEEVLPHVGFRSILVDASGRAYFSAGEGRLHVFDPATSSLSLASARLPGRWLRAATVPGPDGTVYGATREPDALFAFRPDGTVVPLGPARGYVASLALDPSGRWLYYVPDAHGASWRSGAPVVRVDTSTGADEVLVQLNEAIENGTGLKVGGSYNVAVDPSGRRLFVGLNAGPPAERSPFGAIVLATVELG